MERKQPYLSGPNRAYHKAIAEICGALRLLSDAVEAIEALDPDGYVIARQLVKAAEFSDMPRSEALGMVADWCDMDDTWQSAVEMSKVLGAMLDNWLVPMIESSLYSGGIDAFLDELVAEGDERIRHVVEASAIDDSEADEPITITKECAR